MKKYNVTILGATGAVGREMLKVLEERQFPIANLKCLSSSRSAGKKLPFCGESITVEEATDQAFLGSEIVLGAAENDIARRFSPAIKEAGAVMVDNSSAFRLDPEVPLVVPEINPEDVKWHKGLIANPNCSTIIALVAVNPIAKLSPIVNMIASTYQAVSGAGAGGLVELERQSKALVNGEPLQIDVFPYQIAYNLIPQIGGFNAQAYTSEEMKMLNEGRKILHNQSMDVTCTCIRVPVMRSHSISLVVRTEDKITPQQAQAAVAAAPGCRLVDNPTAKRYPMPLDTSDQDTIFVGRIRQDLTSENGLALWCCGDQIRKGAATNAIQIAELLIRS